MKNITILIVLLLSAINAYSQSMPGITRLEGVGAGENFLELADGEYAKILGNATNGEVTYKSGAAPIRVQIVNPLTVKEGTLTVDAPTTFMLPLNEGLIPNDVVIKLRVDNPYQLAEGNGQFNISTQPTASNLRKPRPSMKVHQRNLPSSSTLTHRPIH